MRLEHSVAKVSTADLLKSARFLVESSKIAIEDTRRLVAQCERDVMPNKKGTAKPKKQPKKKALREDFSQAAARIVREATEKT